MYALSDASLFTYSSVRADRTLSNNLEKAIAWKSRRIRRGPRPKKRKVGGRLVGTRLLALELPWSLVFSLLSCSGFGGSAAKACAVRRGNGASGASGNEGANAAAAAAAGGGAGETAAVEASAGEAPVAGGAAGEAAAAEEESAEATKK